MQIELSFSATGSIKLTTDIDEDLDMDSVGQVLKENLDEALTDWLNDFTFNDTIEINGGDTIDAVGFEMNDEEPNVDVTVHEVKILEEEPA